LNVMSRALNITIEDIDFITEKLTEAIKTVTDDLIKAGVRIS